MNPWIIIVLVTASFVFVIDYLLRKKKWKDNSKEEKISLLINMFSVGPHIFLSALGLFWGIVAGSPDTAFGVMLYKATLTMGSAYFAVAAVAVIMSLIFRKKGRIKASIWANIIAFTYITVVLIVNSLADKML
jgi:hypothetical protein